MIGVIDSSSFLNGPSGVYVYGKYAYTIGGLSNTFVIIDVSNPSNPTLSSSTTTNWALTDGGLFISGKYAYITSYGQDAFMIYDISGIETPTINTGSIQTNSLHVTDNAQIANDAYIGSSLTVGKDLYVTGSASLGNRLQVSVYYNAGGQTLPGNTATVINFDTEIYDPFNKFDLTNDRYTPGQNGYYMACTKVMEQGIAVGTIGNYASIVLNGGTTLVRSAASLQSDANQNYETNLVCIETFMDQNDYLDVQAYTADAGGGTIGGSGQIYTLFFAYKID